MIAATAGTDMLAAYPRPGGVGTIGRMTRYPADTGAAGGAVPPPGTSPATSKRAKTAKSFRLVGILVVVAGISVTVLSFVLQRRHNAFISVARQATATVAGEPAIRKPSKARDREKREKWSYKFPATFTTPEGQDVRADVTVSASRLPPGFSPDNPSSWPGEKFGVLYDPSDLSSVKAAAGMTDKSWTLGYVAGGALILVGVTFFVIGLRR